MLGLIHGAEKLVWCKREMIKTEKNIAEKGYLSFVIQYLLFSKDIYITGNIIQEAFAYCCCCEL